MSRSREAYFVKRISFFACFSLVSCERRDTRYERRGFSHWGG